jgi:hypothetical protein
MAGPICGRTLSANCSPSSSACRPGCTGPTHWKCRPVPKRHSRGDHRLRKAFVSWSNRAGRMPFVEGVRDDTPSIARMPSFAAGRKVGLGRPLCARSSRSRGGLSAQAKHASDGLGASQRWQLCSRDRLPRKIYAPAKWKNSRTMNGNVRVRTRLRRSADRAGLYANSLLTGNFTGNLCNSDQSEHYLVARNRCFAAASRAIPCSH